MYYFSYFFKISYIKIENKIKDKYLADQIVKKDPDQRDYIVSNDKIEATGFKTEYSILDGINELIKSFAYIKNNKFTNI